MVRCKASPGRMGEGAPGQPEHGADARGSRQRMNAPPQSCCNTRGKKGGGKRLLQRSQVPPGHSPSTLSGVWSGATPKARAVGAQSGLKQALGVGCGQAVLLWSECLVPQRLTLGLQPGLLRGRPRAAEMLPGLSWRVCLLPAMGTCAAPQPASAGCRLYFALRRYVEVSLLLKKQSGMGPVRCLCWCLLGRLWELRWGGF